ENAQYGIEGMADEDCAIIGNTVINLAGRASGGIHLRDDCRRMVVANNVVTGDAGVGIDILYTGEDITFADNIVSLVGASANHAIQIYGTPTKKTKRIQVVGGSYYSSQLRGAQCSSDAEDVVFVGVTLKGRASGL